MGENGKTYCLENDILKIQVDALGAQLCSVKSSTREYLWNGDPECWSWHSPILFPFVGRLKNGEYTHEGKTYPMTQHGFARELEFQLEGLKEKEIWFGLRWQEETLKRYPFHFVLHIGYRLEGNSVQVMWRVENREENRRMYFAIGGHPGFRWPVEEGTDPLGYFIEFDRQEIEYYSIDSRGLLLKESHRLPLAEGRYQLQKDTFDKDALVIEPYRTQKISLCTPDKRPYVTMEFDSPSVGIYSQAGLRAPYLCIEPWYGRCDNADFEGELREREHEQCLEPGNEFKAGYRMTFF